VDFRQIILANRRKVRRFVYPTSLLPLVGVLTGLYFNLGPVSVSVSLFGIVLVSVFIFLGLVEFVLRTGGDDILLSPSQTNLFRMMESLVELIDGAKSIALMGGTFKSFTDNMENVHALSRHGNRENIRVLMLCPGELGIQGINRARLDRYPSFGVNELDHEVIKSLQRFCKELGVALTCRVVRLYTVPPTISVYQFDCKIAITLYTFGRGASSPAVLVTDRCGNEFCDSIKRGIDELWQAQSTLQLTEEVLLDLGAIQRPPGKQIRI